MANSTATVGARETASKTAPRARRRAHRRHDPLTSLGGRIPLPIPVPDWSKPVILALLLLALALGVRSALAVRRARRLEGQRTTLLRDLSTMQTALVPEVPARLGGLGLSVAYRPADGPAAGGDFYDLFVPEPGKVAIILGDVSGHGREALKQAALTRYTLRAYVQAGLEPRGALALAGRALADPAIEHYATVAVGIYDEQSNRLTYALAGHPPPILSGPGAHEPLTLCASPPIGWGTPTGRRQSTISLGEGSSVCFFSDGLVESRTHDGLLGRERLAEILGGLGAKAGATDLLAEVRSASESTPDDMAACVLHPETDATWAHIHTEELEVDAKTLAEGSTHRQAAERFLSACGVPLREARRTLELAGIAVAAEGAALIRVTLPCEGDRSGTSAEVLEASHSSREASRGQRPSLRGLLTR